MKTFMRLFIPILMPVCLCICSLLSRYNLDSTDGIYRWSDYCHIFLRHSVSIVIFLVIYQTVYVSFMGAKRYSFNFPPLKLVVATAMIMPFLFLTVQYFSFLFVQLKGGSFEIDAEVESRLVPLLFGTLEAVFFAPVLEELSMRVMMISQAQTRKGIVFAVIVSTLLFSILHLDHFISHLLTGGLYALALITTKNIWCPILCHALYNLSISCLGIIQYCNPSLIETDVATGIVRANGMVVIAFAILFLGGITLILRNKALISFMFQESMS